jgi:hypothetical protein
VTPRVAFVWGSVLALSCTRVSDRERFASAEDDLRIEVSIPAAGTGDVLPDARIDLCLSARVDPRSPDETDATVSSGQTLVDSELDVQLVPWQAAGAPIPDVDAEVPWCEGSVISVAPRALLTPGVRYRLRLRPTLFAWDGSGFDIAAPGWVEHDDGTSDYFLEFTVGTRPPEPDPEPPPPITMTDLFAPGGPLDPAVGRCSCHLDPDDLALARLDLRSPEVAYEALLGDARQRDNGFPMVSAREPSASFLVHKLVRDVDGERLEGLLGDAMPPDDPLPYPELRMILQWIADGALP